MSNVVAVRKHLCWVSYAPKMERVNGIAPSSRPWHSRILRLNHTRKQGCPQPDFHRQPDA